MSELPKGWEKTALGEVVRLRGEKCSPQLSPNAPFIGLEDIEPHTSRVIQYRRAGELKSAAACFSSGEILYSRLRPYLNKVLVADRDGLASAEFLVLQPQNGTDAEFVRRRIMMSDFLEFTASLDKGDRPRVDYRQVANFPIELPPPFEQRRIVTKLNSLTGRTARAREELGRIPRLIQKYRAAILAAAFSGELTKHLTSAAKQSWSSSRIDTIASVGTGATPKRGTRRYYEGGTIPWVTSAAANQPFIDNADEFITEAALDKTNCKVFPAGTLLLAMYGEGQTRGRVATLRIPAATNQALAAIQVKPDGLVLRDFLMWFLRAQYFELREKAAGGVQPNLNLGIVKSFLLPVPPQHEQAEIIRHIETAFAWLDRVAAEYANASRLLPKLNQAILAKAFRGELVPQSR